MKSWSIVEFQPDDPSGMHIQAIMLWESIEAFEKAIEANIPEVRLVIMFSFGRSKLMSCRPRRSWKT